MDKPAEISHPILAGVDPAPTSPFSAADPSPSDLSKQLENVGLGETANEQRGGMTVSDVNGGEGNDLKAESGDEEGGIDGDDGWSQNENMIERKRVMYPVRPEAENCAFYMKTGNCKFGWICKFNHPVRRTNQAAMDTVKEEDGGTDMPKIDCKYYFRTGGCKYGESCRYNHAESKTSLPLPSKLNFLGLPIRPGEKECSYYMRNGSCKFGSDCKFNHPDPSSTIASNGSPSFYGNGGSIASQTSSASWSSPNHMNGTAPYMPIMFAQNHGGVLPQTSEWNGYQASVHSQERSVLRVPSYPAKNSSAETSSYPMQRPVDEFPERPDQPECSYYIKTGDCKFKYRCKYHHPKDRVPKQLPCALNDKGLPLRPGQNICAHYSRFGICKFGPSCKFDHSVQPPCSSGNPQATEAPQGDEIDDGWN